MKLPFGMQVLQTSKKFSYNDRDVLFAEYTRLHLNMEYYLNGEEHDMLNILTRSEHEPPEQYLLAGQERTEGQH